MRMLTLKHFLMTLMRLISLLFFSDGLHICIDYAITSNFTNDGHKKARIDCCVELQPKAGNATEVLS